MIGSPLSEPTLAQELRWDLIRQIGCLACRLRFPKLMRLCEIHHLTRGGHHGMPRLGHDHTIGLCAWHHRGEPEGSTRARKLRAWLGPSYFHEAVDFREVFGDDEFLLEAQNQLVERFRRLTFITPRVPA
jgi:hypothetical protein